MFCFLTKRYINDIIININVCEKGGKMNYRIGLDIGITSVGWAVIEDDLDGNPIRIVDLGSRIFDAAEVPKTGAPLAEARRNARGARRRNRRKVHRIKRTKELLLKSSIISKEELEKIYTNIKYNIYELRVAGLDRKLREDELARVLLNLVKKRGYKSNSKSAEEKDIKENAKALKAISDNRNLMKEKGYRSVAEMYLKDKKFKLTLQDGSVVCDGNGIPVIKIRNSVDDYKTTVERSLLLDEISKILTVQKSFNPKITDEFIQEYINIFSSQRNYDEGPAFPSKYGGNLIENMLGNCTFERNEKRAPKSTYSFEMFKLLQDLNSIRIQKVNLLKSNKGNVYHKSEQSRNLNDDEKSIILEALKLTSELSYARIRKLINLPYDSIFNIIDYDFRNTDLTIEEIINKTEKETKNKLVEFQSFHKIRKALDNYEKNYISSLDWDTLDKIAIILTLYKSDEKRIDKLSQMGLPSKVIDKLLPLSFSKVGHLSIVALKKLIPYLKEGVTYDKAASMVYGDFRGKINTEKKLKLSLRDIEEITNPVVRRGVSQAIKVLNAITLKYGKPDLVNIELARELSKNFADRKRQEKEMVSNMEANQKIINEIKGNLLKENITGIDIVKYKLWTEQDGRSPYSGEVIPLELLFTKDVDIDHIIPYSKCFNDGYNNKVLVKSSENRMKTNRTPLEYLTDTNQDTQMYISRVMAMYAGNRKKRDNLLKEHFTEEDEQKFKERNLKDTEYISRVVLNLISKQLDFKPNSNIAENKRAMAVKGGITDQIRKRLNIVKVRDNDIHHAIDATIVAITTESMIQKITRFFKNKENRDNDNNISKEQYYETFPQPYKNFELELKARLLGNEEDIKTQLEKLDILEYKLHGYPKPIFVSRMPKRKVRGSAHMETIRGIGKNGMLITKTNLSDLKLNKENEIEGYYNKQDDRLLYEALRNRLIEYNNDAKEAFKEPFFKPKSDGTKGPIVKKVKIESPSSKNVYLSKMHGAAGNGDTVRIDVFFVEGEGYYFIPIYVADTIKQELPNKAPVAHKNYEEWKEMDEKDFIFSLYPGDLVYVKSKGNINLVPMAKDSKRKNICVNEMLGYYIKCNISSANISISTHDRMYWQDSLGVKRLLELKKYQVDVLGNYSEVKLPEKRMKFNLKKVKGEKISYS